MVPVTYTAAQAEVSLDLSRNVQGLVTAFRDGLEGRNMAESWETLSTGSSPSGITESSAHGDWNMVASRGSSSGSTRPLFCTLAELGAMDPAVVRERTTGQAADMFKQTPAPPPKQLFVKEKAPEVTAQQSKIIQAVKEAARSLQSTMTNLEGGEQLLLYDTLPKEDK